ncbi:MAG: hypothetical protein GX458_02070 [Phyllobacteriaceae bacterium]|nr:hypothetical protein [Phyllobacteriaceae bacterium]
MPQYMIIMGLYTALAIFLLYIVLTIVFRTKNFWEQVMGIVIIIPYLMRILQIK